MRFITLLLLLLSFSVYSQEFHEQLAIESCECVAQIDLESLTYEQREVQLGVCLIVSLGKFSKELENTYGKTFIDFDEKEQILLFEKVGFKMRSEEHTSELQSRGHLVCRLLLEKKK